MTPAIETNNLTKFYGTLKALDGITVAIGEGEVFGLLGPNGAGKTTFIRILTTLIRPASGTAMVFGMDAVKDAAKVREVIGVVPQAMTTDLDLTGFEALDIYARFYGMAKKERRARIEGLLAMIGLKDRARDLVATYSGGMRRRLEIARGLVHRPRILILDEPTIGLDPQSRHVVWELLQSFRKEDRLTVLLTTHYMEEAESLCDRVAIIDYGKIAALDTVDGLKRLIPEKDSIELAVGGADVEKAVNWAKTIRYIASCRAVDNTLHISADRGAEVLPLLIEGLKSQGVPVVRIILKQQTLEDVFIHFTGRPIREEEVKKVSFLLGAGVPSKWGR
ncbi:MAG: ATP-binding cassette domain-containing protein [Deltaproteobacteria bacterium]|nr:ATP-binding cassette domain-containing protein [Deltaproteobacteria bacterium]MBI5809922.1 ATP-binding cassette domain-containing protein [Deltaproteobacteria bacterium]